MILSRQTVCVLVLSCASLMYSCSPLYIPSARTLNHFSSRYEVNASGMIDLSGFEGRAAFSATNHIMIHGSFSRSIYGLQNDRDTTSIGGMEGSHDHRMIEVGGGYFGKVFNHPLELQGGFSRGKSDAFEDQASHDGATHRPTSGRISAAYSRFFIQAGTPFLRVGSATMSMSVRLSRVKFSKIESQTTRYVFDKRQRFYFIEPAADLRFNIKQTPLYLLANVGFSRRVDNGPRQRTSRGHVPEVWAVSNVLGIGVHLNQLKQNR